MLPTIVKVDYTVLRDNFLAIQRACPAKTLAPVIKADAYGHGILETARTFIDAGAKILTVFRLEEAEYLRGNGISSCIWVLLGPLPGEARRAAQLQNVTYGIFSLEQAQALSQACVKAGNKANVHIAIDTGMGRLGFTPDDVPAAIAALLALPGITLKGAYSHFATATDPASQLAQKQVAAFRSAIAALPPQCNENHCCASDALLNNLLPELKYARPGICLYAECTLPGETTPLTQDAMSLTTEIVSLKKLPKGSSISYGALHTLERDSLIAIAPLGYDDGLLRCLSDKFQVLIHGQRANQLGRICMSMIMIDVTDIPDVKTGDQVVIMGRQGSEKITVNELTAIANTTQHEFLCAFGRHR